MAVKEQQVDKEFLAAYFDPVLIADKRETLPNSHDKIFDISYRFFFEDPFIFCTQRGYKIHEVFVLEYLQGGGL